MGYELTNEERRNLAMDAAREVCKKGYTPADAAQVVKLDANDLANLVAWYDEWAAGDAPAWAVALAADSGMIVR